MTEPMDPTRPLEIENHLEAIYNAASPDPGFANRLEMQLAERVRAMKKQGNPPKASWSARLRGFLHQPAFAVTVTVVFLVILAISLIGPQKVLAQVQRLFGYAPGNGFVLPGETRILPAPVEQRQGVVTLRIEKVLADAQQTQVILQVSGLPREKFDLKSVAGEAPEEAQPYLLLPDGARLSPGSFTSGIGDVLQASLSFPALPAGVDRVTLVLPRLPSLPAGFAPENWSVPLTLQATISAGTQSAPGFPLTQPYTPENASALARGVTVSLLQVGQSREETGLQVQFRWDHPGWKWLTPGEPRLADETDREYARRQPALGSNFEPGGQTAREGSRTTTYRFDPFEPEARGGVLTFDELAFRFNSGTRFSFDPGREVTDSQTWDLSQAPGTQLNLAGVPVQLLSLTVSPNPYRNAPPEDRYLLTLLLETTPQDGLTMDYLSLSLFPDRGTSGSCEQLPENHLKLTIGIPDLPKRALHLYFPDGELSVTGPWKIAWNLPPN